MRQCVLEQSRKITEIQYGWQHPQTCTHGSGRLQFAALRPKSISSVSMESMLRTNSKLKFYTILWTLTNCNFLNIKKTDRRSRVESAVEQGPKVDRQSEVQTFRLHHVENRESLLIAWIRSETLKFDVQNFHWGFLNGERIVVWVF